MILGIDPGLTGGLAIRGRDVTVIEPMPAMDGEITLVELTSWLRENKHQVEMAYLEKAQAMPKQGVSSTFNYGKGFGAVMGVLSALGIPFELVTPQRWTRVMHLGIESDLGPKAKSRIAVARLFPQFDLRESPRCKKPHEGMVDALLLAEFGYRTYSLQKGGLSNG
jgi:crossover junction endodeoxyribonuclease RuvC